MTTTEPPQDRLGAEARRDTIIAAAWETLAEYGLEGVTIEAIVTRVGVSRPIFYRHFADRTDVLAALFEDYMGELSSAVVSAIADATTLEEVVVRSVHTYFQCFDRRGPYVRSLVDHVTRSPKFEETRQRVRDHNLRIVSETFSRLGLDFPSTSVLTQMRFLQAAAMEAAIMRAEAPQSRDEIEAIFTRFERAAVAAIAAELSPPR